METVKYGSLHSAGSFSARRSILHLCASNPTTPSKSRPGAQHCADAEERGVACDQDRVELKGRKQTQHACALLPKRDVTGGVEGAEGGEVRNAKEISKLAATSIHAGLNIDYAALEQQISIRLKARELHCRKKAQGFPLADLSQVRDDAANAKVPDADASPKELGAPINAQKSSYHEDKNIHVN